MTEQQYYEPAEKKISELKAAGKDPYKKTRHYVELARLDGKHRFSLKDTSGKEFLELVLVKSKFGFDVVGFSHPDVKLLSYSPFNTAGYDDMVGKMTLEFLAMAYNPDITVKQYAIDCCRAEGMDI